MKTVEKTWNMLFVISNQKQKDLLHKYAEVCNVKIKHLDGQIYSIDQCPNSQKLLDKFMNTLDVKGVFTDLYPIKSDDKKMTLYVMI